MENQPKENREIDGLAAKGHLKANDIPDSDLFDQAGDETNVTESGDDHRRLSGDNIRRENNIPPEFSGGKLRVVDENDVLDNEDDEAARWLAKNDPELK